MRYFHYRLCIQTGLSVVAKRCLATNGYLLIAETTKSMKGRLSKLRAIVKDQSFEIYKEEQKGDFMFIEARKI